MFAIPKINPLVRAVLVVGGVAGLVTGVTLATHDTAVATITDSTVNTATENLHISTTGAEGTFVPSIDGFDFDNLVPGGVAMPLAGNEFWLKNDGGTNFGNITVGIPLAPTTTGTPDLSKVDVVITDPGADGVVGGGDDVALVNQSMDSLVTTDAPLAVALPAGSPAKKLFVQVSMDTGAFAGETASVSDFDLEFTGVAPTAP
jgi:hypothetical protein